MATDDFEFILSNPNPMDVYIRQGAQVDPWASDIEVKAQSYVKITSQGFPSLKSSFVAYVLVNGLGYYTNQQYLNVLLVDFNKIRPPTTQME
jgi:hypothetical protein